MSASRPAWDLVPDVAVLAEAMERSLDELVAEADRRDRPVPWWHAEVPPEHRTAGPGADGPRLRGGLRHRPEGPTVTGHDPDHHAAALARRVDLVVDVAVVAESEPPACTPRSAGCRSHPDLHLVDVVEMGEGGGG